MLGAEQEESLPSADLDGTLLDDEDDEDPLWKPSSTGPSRKDSLKSADQFSDIRFCIADMNKLLDLANRSGPHICDRAGCSPSDGGSGTTIWDSI